MVGRYERGEMTPSIDVAKKLADSLDVTLDFLSGSSELPEAFRDKKMVGTCSL
ncbi:MAG: helix-turn-helix transcriptional regulator [Deltaproteobacteria bacterium]|nr:helix-turn-helix transcriptional regulator [Deltaproteobacteria bacterium]